MFDELTFDEMMKLKNMKDSSRARKDRDRVVHTKMNGFVLHEVVEYYYNRNTRCPQWLKGKITAMNRQTASVQDTSGIGPKNPISREYEGLRKVSHAQE